jgi:hypothetical protein
MICSNCKSALAPGDAFCGECGAQAETGGNGREANVDPGSPVVRAVPEASVAASPEPFFSHARSRPDGWMTNATRYLCAAAYLSAEFTNRVIRELVSSHRAVAPSVGIDLAPIIRHCLRSRRMNLVRDLVLCVLLLIGLFVAAGQTIAILFVCFFVGFLPSVNWARKSLGMKIVAILFSLLAFAVLGFVVLSLLVATLIRGIENDISSGSFGGLSAASGLAGLTPGLILAIALLATQVAYVYARNRTLCEDLAPAASPRPFVPQAPVIEARIQQVEAAQRGNLLLYSGEDPFVGTGWVSRSWSIPIELRRAADRKRGSWPSPPATDRRHDYVPIDPANLHQVIRDRLLSLKDEELPRNERVEALDVRDHVIGPGWLPWDSPLIDPDLSIPYSEASPAATDALIRHPQAGLRYFQRVSVRDEGQTVWSGREKVVESMDQDISASAFVYVAVEGRMFYLEFVATIMPPIQARWHAVDLLPRLSAGGFFARVVVDALGTIFRDLIYAPVRAVRSLRATSRERRSYQEQATAAQEYLHADLGARFSVREWCADRDLASYIQVLDLNKYTKLVERLVLDTTLDFLSARGVDVSAFAGSASAVINSGVIISGSTFGGPAAVSATGDVSQTVQAQPEPAH